MENNIRKYELRNIKSSDYENYPIVYGIDFNHLHKNWFMNYETIFPLKTIEFEGQEFSCINQPEVYLKSAYGAWMKYPKKISMGHCMYKKISNSELDILKEIANIHDEGNNVK